MYKSIDVETQSTCKLPTNTAVLVAVTDLVLLKRAGLLVVKSRERQTGAEGSWLNAEIEGVRIDFICVCMRIVYLRRG